MNDYNPFDNTDQSNNKYNSFDYKSKIVNDQPKPNPKLDKDEQYDNKDPKAPGYAAVNGFGAAPEKDSSIDNKISDHKPASKRKVWAVIGSFLAVLLAIAMPLVIFFMTSVSHKEYGSALDKTKEIARSVKKAQYNSFGFGYYNIDKILQKANKIVDDIQQKIDNAKGEVALKRDPDAKDKFDKLVKVFTDYKNKFHDNSDLVKNMLPLYNKYQERIEYSSFSSNSYSQKIVDHYKSVADTAGSINVKNNDLQEKILKFKDAAINYANYYQGLINDSSSNRHSSLYKLSSEYYNTYSEMSKSFRNSVKDSDTNDKLVDAINDLGQYLTDKYNKQ